MLNYIVYIIFLYIAQFQVDGDWSEWTTWDACSKTCGSGKKARTRMCNNPAPTVDGSPCMGDNRDEKPCNINSCPGSNISKLESRISLTLIQLMI